MKNELLMPKDYENLTSEEMSNFDGGVSVEVLVGFLIRVIGERLVNELIDLAKEYTYSAILSAAKYHQNAAYQAWVREFNRHQYCCQGNGIGKGCPGRG